ncbi:MAG: hypothetical protein ACK56I_04240, partial [bacterium]
MPSHPMAGPLKVDHRPGLGSHEALSIPAGRESRKARSEARGQRHRQHRHRNRRLRGARRRSGGGS